jgi:hypothetical protein
MYLEWKARDSSCEKNKLIDIYSCEGVDNTKNYAKMNSYHATFGPP